MNTRYHNIDMNSSNSNKSDFLTDTEYVKRDFLTDIYIPNLVASNNNMNATNPDTLISFGNLKQHDSVYDMPILSKKYSSHSRNIYFQKTQKWVGYILEIADNSFNAKLKDLTNKGTDEIGEFEFDEVTKEDLPLLSVGAIFYWSIGYSHAASGQVSKVSIIRFQRAYELSEEDKSDAIERTNGLFDSIIWE